MRTDAPRLAPRFNALDAAVLDDPYPTYKALRDAGRICRVAPASLGVTRHADVFALLRDRRLGNDFPIDDPQFTTQRGQAGDSFERIIPTQDDARHDRLRHLMVKAFSPSAARARADEIRGFVGGVLDAGLEAGSFDAAADLAFPVAVRTMCALLGLPDDAYWEIRPNAAALSNAYVPFLPDDDRDGAERALVWFRDYVRAVVDDRRTHPRGDLLSAMLGASGDGGVLSDDEVVDNVCFVCFTGFETSMSMIANGCAALVAHPAEFDKLRARPRLVPRAIEEFLRLDAPMQYTARVALEPIDVGDRTIKKGRSVFLLLGSANHDERRFARPDELVVDREPNPHVSFGGGVRGCFGVALARVEGAVVFEELVRCFSMLRADGDPIRTRHAIFRSHASVPVAVRPT